MTRLAAVIGLFLLLAVVVAIAVGSVLLGWFIVIERLRALLG